MTKIKIMTIMMMMKITMMMMKMAIMMIMTMMMMRMIIMIIMMIITMLRKSKTPGELPGREVGTVLELLAFQIQILANFVKNHYYHQITSLSAPSTLSSSVITIITIKIITTIISFQMQVHFHKLELLSSQNPSLIIINIFKNQQKSSSLLLTTGKMISSPRSTPDQ